MSEPIKAAVSDDADFCRKFMIDLLEDRGYEVIAYKDVDAFISQCCAGQCCSPSDPCVDLLIVDNQKTGLSGLELIEQLVGKGCKVPADCRAVISESWSDAGRRKAESIGCRIFEKPSLVGLGSWLNKYELSRLTCRIV